MLKRDEIEIERLYYLSVIENNLDRFLHEFTRFYSGFESKEHTFKFMMEQTAFNSKSDRALSLAEVIYSYTIYKYWKERFKKVFKELE